VSLARDAVRMPPSAGEPSLIRRCAWCERRYRTGEWITDVEPPDPEHTTATICPRCADELEDQLEPRCPDRCP
jgi:hypothetical protein